MTKKQKTQLNDVQNVLLDIQNGKYHSNDCGALSYTIDAIQEFKEGDVEGFDIYLTKARELKIDKY